MPAGPRAASSDAGRSWATISEYTWHSRILRAISCAYCAPRSTTRTGLRGTEATPLVTHPDALGRLVRLALALDRRRHDELGLLELADRGVAGGRHRGGERPEQVEGPVVLVRGPPEDLLQGRELLGPDERAARQRRMERRHPPVVAATLGLVRARERRTDHHRVRAAGDRLRDVAAGAHAAVGDHVAVAAGLAQMLHAGGRRIRDRRRLRHA